MASLQERIAAAKAKREVRMQQRSRGSQAFHVGLELAAAILVGTVIGYQLDAKLGSSPWLTLLFMMLGTAAGFINLFRTASKLAEPDVSTERKLDKTSKFSDKMLDKPE